MQFEDLIPTYGPRLYAHIRRMVVDHAVADDLLQNVWLKAWKNRSAFRGDSQPATWLFRIAHNEALDHLRREKKRRQLAPDAATAWLTSQATQAFSPDADETIQLLHKAVHTLPERQRTVFEFRYFEELSYEEISNITGTTVGSLKASYHHAVKKIEAFVTQALNPTGV
ncbi:MAG: sigma-70 family RNA polymerase sigma factor [Bacteroidetes bacterium]|jgi:RNA polymerase sigma-70 factor (ECF subfamily)|nr:sigma-70 family RNA polymerase sigma factor [Bacteroidota bacterium]